MGDRGGDDENDENGEKHGDLKKVGDLQTPVEDLN